MADTSLRGFNPVGNTTRVPVQCVTCRNVTTVFIRNVSWGCPYCGTAYYDGTDKYMVDKDVYRQKKKVVDLFNINRLQKELYGLPQNEAEWRSRNIVNNLRHGIV